MKSGSAKRERGIVLLAMLAVIMLGASWLLVRQLNAESGGLDAARKIRNAEVLSQAKLALIGYVAQQAAVSGEDNPGAFPCPEYPSGFYSTTGNDGKTQTPSCNPLPAVGRFPWRTIGTDKLVDASGEPLWYVVASGWSKPGAASTDNTIINSNCTDATSAMTCWTGQLTVDGQANAAVALIIAPGPTIRKTAGPDCAAGNQVRPQGLDPDRCDYLEGENATPTDATFVTTGPSGTFNDQVVRITVADIMPAIEAAIADRIQREIVPVLKSVYASSAWAANLSAANPLFPYPAPFSNPTTSTYAGSQGPPASYYRGLLPVNLTQSCVPATEPRCMTPATGSSTLLTFFKQVNDSYVSSLLPPIGSILTQSACSWQTNTYVCTGEYLLAPIKVTFTLRVANVAMGFRTYDLAGITCTAVDDVGSGIPLQNIGCESKSLTLQSDGSALITVTTNWTPDILLSGWGTYANYTINFPRSIFGDHAMLSRTDPDIGWFWRNEWYRLLYYVTASGNSADALPTAPSCVSAGNCISVTNVSTTQHGALLVLAGRSINGSPRPSPTLSDYLEFGNATAAYERQPVSKVTNAVLKSPFNDRILIIGSN